MILISVVHLFPSRYGLGGGSLADAFVTVGKIMARKCWPSPASWPRKPQKGNSRVADFFPFSILFVTSSKSIRWVVDDARKTPLAG